MNHPRCGFAAPPQCGAAGGLAVPDPRRPIAATPVARGERGISLLFALLALAALSLAAVGLVRSVGGGSLAIGNLGFKLDATASATMGAEAAITYLTANQAGTTLNSNQVAAGYYATSTDALDATGRNTAAAPRAAVDWNNDNCATVSGAFTACLDPTAATTLGGNSVSWIITRLCSAALSKDDVTNSCASSLSSAPLDDANSGGMDYANKGGFTPAASINPYYRVIVRTLGARNSVSYTETIVHY